MMTGSYPIEGGHTKYVGACYTDDKKSLLHFDFNTKNDYIVATVTNRNDGPAWSLDNTSPPLTIDLKDLTPDTLRIHASDSTAVKDLKTGIQLFLEFLPRTPEQLKPEAEHDAKWEIQIARYFGYNETTLALLKAPDGQHYLARSAGYPYGRPSYDRHVPDGEDIHSKNEPLHWNSFLNDIAK